MSLPLDQIFIDKILEKNLIAKCSWYLLQNLKIFAEFFAIFLTFKLEKLRALKSSQHETLTIQSL